MKLMSVIIQFHLLQNGVLAELARGRTYHYSWQRFDGEGGMAEWLKAHAWKACGRRKRPVGSNPTPSANLEIN